MIYTDATGFVQSFRLVFFFKQKTAYEMRISDWSSDVCSSDLRNRRGGGVRHAADAGAACRHFGAGTACRGHPGLCVRAFDVAVSERRHPSSLNPDMIFQRELKNGSSSCKTARRRSGCNRYRPRRSEEHTSELQSLMRISYAVFCLKKKT